MMNTTMLSARIIHFVAFANTRKIAYNAMRGNNIIIIIIIIITILWLSRALF